MKVLTLSIITTLFPTTDVEAAGRASTTKTTNTILSGPSVPGVSVGKNGDFYIDTKSMNFYGPKKNNLWPIPISLRGPVGPSGASGVDGRNGSTANATAGVAGATGGQGLPGAQGSIGATGPAGAQGSIGATGPAGAQGTTGATGPAGAQGTTGATGSAGVSSASEIKLVNITPWTMSTSTLGGGAESTGFGTLVTGKNYYFSIAVNGQLSSLVSQFRTFPELKCSDGTATINYSYSYGFGLSSDGTDDSNRISFMLTGTISVLSNSSFSVLVRDSAGSGTTVNFTGKAFIQEVGSIS